MRQGAFTLLLSDPRLRHFAKNEGFNGNPALPFFLSTFLIDISCSLRLGNVWSLKIAKSASVDALPTLAFMALWSGKWNLGGLADRSSDSLPRPSPFWLPQSSVTFSTRAEKTTDFRNRSLFGDLRAWRLEPWSIAKQRGIQDETKAHMPVLVQGQQKVPGTP